MKTNHLEQTKNYFSGPNNCNALSELKSGACIAIFIENGPRIFLEKAGQTIQILEDCVSKKRYDFSFHVPEKAFQNLVDHYVDDAEETGVQIFKWLSKTNKDDRIKMQVHVGAQEMNAFGYFGVVAMGGKAIKDELAQAGLSKFFQLRAALEKLRSYPT